MKTFGIAAVAIVAALILGFGARLSSATTAHADTTAVVVVPCEGLADYLDGSTTDTPPDGTIPTTDPELLAACGNGTATVGPNIPPTGAISIAKLATAIGDKDGILEASDLTALQTLGANQIGAGCVVAIATCTLDVFAFTDNESTVTFNAPNGLQFVPSDTSSNDWTCDLNTEDFDCQNVPNNDGNGVVMAGLINGTGTAALTAGDTGTIKVSQDAVESDATITVVGAAHDVQLTLAETTIQSSGSTAAFTTCSTTSDVSDSSSLSAPTSTIAISVVTDAAGTKMTRVPVLLKSGSTDIADIAIGSRPNSVLSNTIETVDAGTNGIAHFAVICGGKNTGTSTISATINKGKTNEDIDSATLTVVGTASAVALTASPAQIACDGSQTATVTAKVTDSAGNNVADGTTVNFSVVALGTANPINVKTTAGSASSTITPLSAGSAGVTVTVTSGDAQASIRVDCSLPVPTAVPPVVGAPTPVGGGVGTIAGPNTGTGGYLNQDGSSSFPMWTLVALALGSVVLVAGGMVTRRADK